MGDVSNTPDGRFPYAGENAQWSADDMRDVARHDEAVGPEPHNLLHEFLDRMHAHTDIGIYHGIVKEMTVNKDYKEALPIVSLMYVDDKMSDIDSNHSGGVSKDELYNHIQTLDPYSIEARLAYSALQNFDTNTLFNFQGPERQHQMQDDLTSDDIDKGISEMRAAEHYMMSSGQLGRFLEDHFSEISSDGQRITVDDIKNAYAKYNGTKSAHDEDLPYSKLNYILTLAERFPGDLRSGITQENLQTAHGAYSWLQSFGIPISTGYRDVLNSEFDWFNQ